MFVKVRRLSDEERSALQGLINSRHTPTEMTLRARIIIFSDQGWHAPQIAKKLEVHPLSVRMRIQRFNTNGMAGLRDPHRSGRPRVYGDKERQIVLQLVKFNPTDLGLPITTWTLNTLQRHLRSLPGMERIGRETIRRILIAVPK